MSYVPSPHPAAHQPRNVRSACGSRPRGGSERAPRVQNGDKGSISFGGRGTGGVGRGAHIAQVFDLLVVCGADNAHVDVAARAHIVEDAYVSGQWRVWWLVLASNKLKETDT